MLPWLPGVPAGDREAVARRRPAPQHHGACVVHSALGAGPPGEEALPATALCHCDSAGNTVISPGLHGPMAYDWVGSSPLTVFFQGIKFSAWCEPALHLCVEIITG